MVNGLEIFRSHFHTYADRYALIGGAACDIAMSDAGLEFRATKDLDIVLFVEALDKLFVEAFWEFVAKGNYQIQMKSGGEKQFYRFQKPDQENYPFMLELFSRRPDVLQVAKGSHLTPLPMEEEISSLSAILMDDDYYEFIRSGRKETDGLSWVGAEHLIPLKARAWLDLTQRKKAGDAVDSKAIKKHKNDVFRLYQIISPFSVPPPKQIQRDLSDFISQVKIEGVDLKSLGIKGNLSAIFLELARAYHLK